jgi:hypothetical protein
MLGMGNKLWPPRFRPSSLRWWGAALALVPGILLALLSLTSGGTNVTGRGIALAAAPIGAALGWLFAPRATRPGWRTGIGAAAGFAAVAVMIGAFVVAALVAMNEPSADPNVAFRNFMTFTVFGLLLLGLPMFAFIFMIALSWVGALRLATGRRRVA